MMSICPIKGYLKETTLVADTLYLQRYIVATYQSRERILGVYRLQTHLGSGALQHPKNPSDWTIQSKFKIIKGNSVPNFALALGTLNCTTDVFSSQRIV